jgi:hypothetical protein
MKRSFLKYQPSTMVLPSRIYTAQKAKISIKTFKILPMTNNYKKGLIQLKVQSLFIKNKNNLCLSKNSVFLIKMNLKMLLLTAAEICHLLKNN